MTLFRWYREVKNSVQTINTEKITVGSSGSVISKYGIFADIFCFRKDDEHISLLPLLTDIDPFLLFEALLLYETEQK